ncbi:MAG: hypothetical protein QXJ07_01930 [Candidatus Bathyarchaeia archaeon]
MGRKLAMITVELVDESTSEKADIIQKELLEWLEENCNFIPWVKKVKHVIIKENQ